MTESTTHADGTEPVGALVFSINGAPTRGMRWDRGTQIRLFGEENGTGIDLHINVINADSGTGPYHYHERAENYYIVLEGRVEVVVEGVRHFLEEGDVGYIPPGLRHYAGAAPGSTIPARVVEIYNPPGVDFNIVDDPTEIVDAPTTG
jgi:quercetin dioxygenase-like cupin family protein